jgi:hypothetical protein
MNIEEVLERHAAYFHRLAARTRLRKDEAKFYVYVWIRHNGEPIYVGKGCGPRAHREFGRGNNAHLHAIIKKDREAGFPDPQRVMIAQNLTENEASELEMQTIAKHKRTKDGGTLTNMNDGGPGREVEAELRQRLKALGKYRRLHVANSQRPAVLDCEECRRQCNINAKSGRGAVLKRLFEQPSTMEELCEHIKVMPPLGPYKGSQPATEGNVGAALIYIGKRAVRVSQYRLVLSEADVYSIVIQECA